ncbi:MAG: gliding motility protein [Acidobacteriota bacterium]
MPPQLAALFDVLHPDAPLADRLDALENVARAVFDIGRLRRAPAPIQLTRLRNLLRVLASSPVHRDRLRATLASVLRDTSAVALFSEAGIPSDRGLATETIDRISRLVLPRPPDDENLERFVSRVFRHPRDCAWIEAAPLELFTELGQLLGDLWRPLRDAMSDAIALLATRISALGLGAELRERSDPMHVRDSPFFRIQHVPLEQMPMLILECRQQLSTIHARLETTGVSVDVVYCLDAIRRMLLRIDRMLPFLLGRATAAAAKTLLGALTAGRIADDSLRGLGKQNLGLLAKKVIERVGHGGERYVTTNRREYFKLLLSAAGGGAIAAFTVIGKLWARWAHFAPFIDGLLASADYAGSFLAMQFLGFTLATKQPSMTAANLAATIKEAKGKHDLDELVVIIARIARSQFAAACGNVLAVIPVAIALDVFWVTAAGHHFLDARSAAAAIASLDPLHSGTIVFAAVTGVLLWMSSLGAGWLENWVTYRRLPDAIRHHRIGRTVGRDKLGRIADFVVDHTAGIGGNVSLGLLLGLVPVFATFFGLPFEIRHITLETGTLAFAGCTLGLHAVTVTACIGIVCIGLLNFGVSFALALAVAFRAREVTGRERVGLAVAVGRAFLRRPLAFFYPPRPGRALTAPVPVQPEPPEQ